MIAEPGDGGTQKEGAWLASPAAVCAGTSAIPAPRIRFRSWSAIARTVRKQISTAFSLIVALPKGALDIGGELSAYRDVGASGQTVVRRFCGACGSAIMTDAAAYPTMEFLKAGTLDGTSWLKPDTQFWCDSAQGWLTLDDDIAQLARNPSLE